MELRMSRKERDRLKVLELVGQGKVSQVRAGELLGLSERQVRRLVKRYGVQGTRAGASLAGPASNRRKPRKSAGRLYVESRRPIRTSDRRWRRKSCGSAMGSKSAGRRCASDDRRGPLESRRRQGSPSLLAAAQRVFRGNGADGHFDSRLAGRSGKKSLVLIAMIDDATSRLLLRFYRSDTTETNMSLLRFWIKRYGRPLALYADKASHFITTRQPTLEEELQGRSAQTQIDRG